MKTICFFDKAGGFAENLRKHPSALQTGDHYVILPDLNMPGEIEWSLKGHMRCDYTSITEPLRLSGYTLTIQ